MKVKELIEVLKQVEDQDLKVYTEHPNEGIGTEVTAARFNEYIIINPRSLSKTKGIVIE